METTRIIGGLAFAFAFIGTFCLAVFLVAAIAGWKKLGRVLGNTGTSSSPALRLLRNGIKPLFILAGALLKIVAFQQLMDDMVRVCRYNKIETSPKALSSLIAAVWLVLLGFSFVATSSAIFGITSGGCLILGLHMWIKREDDKRREELRDQLPEALQSMKACFCVGYSLQQTLEQVGKETKGTLSQIFIQAHKLLESGGTISQALEYIRESSVESELVFIATALEIQHKTGSSMQAVIEAARESVIDEIELKRTLKTQTAQAKLSAQIVTLMPFVLIALFSFISPGFLDPFFESFIGIVMLVAALSMQLVGVLMVRKTLRVEVA